MIVSGPNYQCILRGSLSIAAAILIIEAGSLDEAERWVSSMPSPVFGDNIIEVLPVVNSGL
jgi:hypothetical protein